MKLGDGELEPTGTEISLSILEARALFMRLILSDARQAVDHLLRIYNSEDLPIKLTQDPKANPFLTYFVMGYFRDPSVFDQLNFEFGPNIRKTPIHELIDFVRVNKKRFAICFEESSNEWHKATKFPPEELIVEAAYKKLVPNWPSLAADTTAKNLCSSIMDWANNWNLNDEWCLDFALNALISFKIDYVDPQNLFGALSAPQQYYGHFDWTIRDWGTNSWRNAVYEFHNEKHQQLCGALANIPDSDRFVFEWGGLNVEEGRSFRVDEYFAVYSSSEPEFREIVEDRFWQGFFSRFEERPRELVGQTEWVSKEISRFHNNLETYVKRCKKQNIKHGRRVVEKDTGDLHFRWLIAIQLCGDSYSELSRRYGRTNKAIESAVRSTGKMIGLTVRQMIRTGRPIGIVEHQKRHRAAP